MITIVLRACPYLWVQNLEILNMERGHLETHATSDADPNIKILIFQNSMRLCWTWWCPFWNKVQCGPTRNYFKILTWVSKRQPHWPQRSCVQFWLYYCAQELWGLIKLGLHVAVHNQWQSILYYLIFPSYVPLMISNSSSLLMLMSNWI